MAAAELIEVRPLVCGMCNRRICDIAIIHGNVHLLGRRNVKAYPKRSLQAARRELRVRRWDESRVIRMSESSPIIPTSLTVSGSCTTTNATAAGH